MHAEYPRHMKPLADRFPEASFLRAGNDDIDENGVVIRRGLDTGRVEMIRPGSKPWRVLLYEGAVWTISGSLSKADRLRHYGFRQDLPHLGIHEFLLRAIRRDRFVYLEKPLDMAAAPSAAGRASRYGRRSLDLSRDVFAFTGEQRARISRGIRSWRRGAGCSRDWTGYQIARRSAGQAARGRPLQALATLSLLPKLASSLLP